MRIPTRLLVLLLLALYPRDPAAAAERPLRVAVDNNFPPMSWVVEGPKLVGFNVDVANALCAEIGRECDMKAVGMGDRVPGLMMKRFDVLVTPLSSRDPWAHAVSLTRPYCRTASVFIAPTGFDGTFDGKRIAVKDNSPYADYVHRHFGKGAHVKPFTSFRDAFDALEDGDVDLVFAPAFAAVHFIDKTGGKTFAMTGAPVTEGQFREALHIATRKENPSLFKALDAALAKISEDGTLAKIAGRYFPPALLEAVLPEGAGRAER